VPVSLQSRPTGNRNGRSDLLFGKHHIRGMNVQVVADLSGRLCDTGTPVAGSRHDSVALVDSGVAAGRAGHLAGHGPGRLADKGYLSGPLTRLVCGVACSRHLGQVAAGWFAYLEIYRVRG
jgi:hypothetical protein